MTLPRTCAMVLTWLVGYLLLPAVTADPIVDWQLPALMEFRNANLVINKQIFQFWRPGTDCSDWWFVTCEAGQVTKIELSGQIVGGVITAGLGSITSLKTLDLSKNSIYGSLPSSFGNLVNLVELKLRENKLSGQIPPEWGNLVNLETLDLAKNYLRQISSNFGERLSKLKILHLDNNHFVGEIPQSLGGATGLENVHLEFNSLSGSVPFSLGNCTRLTYLALNDNHLSGSVPESFGNLVALQELYLSNNLLSGSIPESFGNLVALQKLWLDSNQFDGTLPSSFGNMTSLTELYLNDNFFTGNLPQNIGNLVNLQTLEISAPNNFTGRIPASIGNLVGATKLSLTFMSLTGEIPSTIGKLISLQELNLQNNQLSGLIPSSIGGLTSLQTLYLNFNQLSGSIPDSIGRLGAIVDLEMYDNSLNGSIPTSLQYCTNLKYLFLHNNALSGVIPPEVRKLQQLQYLALDRNKLTGSIPPNIGDLSQLQYLDLSNNSLSGQIPPSFSKFSSLSVIYLENNLLNGTIPASITNGPVAWLSLSNNRFTGNLPSNLGSNGYLNYLDVSYNRLTGVSSMNIPPYRDLSIFLRNNQFSGTVPTNMGSYVRILDLSFNYFTTIPNNLFENYYGMYSIYLNDNDLVGTVPPFGSVSNVFWLQNNFLTGGFYLGMSSPPASLNLSNNYFNGTMSFNAWSLSPNRYCVSGALTNNCLFNEDVFCDLDKQRNTSECELFCNTTQPLGVCSSAGMCLKSRASPVASCRCNYGFNGYLANGTCTAVGNKARGLLPPTNSTTQFSNRWLRYGSSGYSATSRKWNIYQKWNWVQQGGFDRVGDQQTCGASWTFSPISAIESAIFIASGGSNYPALSVQQILDCQGTLKGCSGGWPGNTLEFAASNNIATATAWPFTGKIAKTCSNKNVTTGFKISSYERTRPFRLLDVLLAVMQGPLGVMIEASSSSFIDYKGGYIYDDPSCFSGGVDHIVVVVGYDLTTSPPHLIIKNSWGTTWGERGFMRISIRGGFGTCGIFSTAGFVPIVKGSDPCQSRSFGAVKIANNTFGAGSLNPCGAGNCSVIGQSNRCSCPDGFSAANNTDGSQTCVPASPCTFYPFNPCGMGTCLNVDSSPGMYTCVCPLGFVLSFMSTDGTPTCLSDATTLAGLQTFRVPSGPTLTCDILADVFGIASPILKQQQLPDINCSAPLPALKVLNVRGAKSCALPYITTKNDTCASIASLFLLPAGTPFSGPGSPNLNLPCDAALPGGKQICIKTGTPLENPLCTATFTLPPGSTCRSVMNSTFKNNATTFFSLNPSINCGSLFPPMDNPVLLGPDVCTSATSFEGIKRSCTGSKKVIYSVVAGDTCLSILKAYFSGDQVQFRRNNMGWMCDDTELVVSATICRPK